MPPFASLFSQFKGEGRKRRVKDSSGRNQHAGRHTRPKFVHVIDPGRFRVGFLLHATLRHACVAGAGVL